MGEERHLGNCREATGRTWNKRSPRVYAEPIAEESSERARRNVQDQAPATSVRSLDHKLLFEVGVEGMLIATLDGDVLDVNPEACRLLRRRREDIIEAGCEGVFSPSDPGLRPALGELDRTGRFKGELRLLRRDESPFAAELSMSTYQADMLGIIFRDVTGRKRAEEALRESEEWFRSLVQNMPDLVIVLEADTTVRYVSRSAERVVGYRPEEWIGERLAGYVQPYDLESLAGAVDETLAIPGPEAGKGIVIHLRHKDGSWRCLEGVANDLLNDPKRGLVVLIVRDVTGQRRAEEDLRRTKDSLEGRVAEHAARLETLASELESSERMRRESEERFRATFDVANIGIAHLRLDGRCLRVNKRLCDILGYAREELLERPLWYSTHFEDLDAELEYFRRMLQGERTTCSVEKRHVKKDYSRVWVSLTLSLVREPSGDPAYFISIVEDITEHRRASLLIESLTSREIEVLKLLAQGRSNQKIAESMNFSVGTVKNHVRRVISKLGVSGRSQAAARAAELGILSTGGGARSGTTATNSSAR